MRTAEIKEKLSKVGISYEGRGELVAKLVQGIEEEVQKMSTAEIKGELFKRCISYEGRGELVGTRLFQTVIGTVRCTMVQIYRAAT